MSHGGGRDRGTAASVQHELRGAAGPWSPAIKAMSEHELKMALHTATALRLDPRPSLRDQIWKPKDLKKFAGDIEHYPDWREKINYCLEQYKSTSERQRAVFIIEQTSGRPEAQIRYLTRPYIPESAKLMLKRLDLASDSEVSAM